MKERREGSLGWGTVFVPAHVSTNPIRRHSGMVRRTRPQMCDRTSGNLEIPGSMLTHRPGMTETISRFTMTRFITSLALVLAGLVLFGQGAYIHAKALLAQVLLERAFSETIASGREVKPWSWADTWPVARIEVKRLHASTIVLAGSSGQALAFGPGHVERTPDAGERGVAVYSAHRDTHFRFLRDVAIGDA